VDVVVMLLEVVVVDVWELFEEEGEFDAGRVNSAMAVLRA
jgi:hypothetical protein